MNPVTYEVVHEVAYYWFSSARS